MISYRPTVQYISTISTIVFRICIPKLIKLAFNELSICWSVVDIKGVVVNFWIN